MSARTTILQLVEVGDLSRRRHLLSTTSTGWLYSRVPTIFYLWRRRVDIRLAPDVRNGTTPADRGGSGEGRTVVSTTISRFRTTLNNPLAYKPNGKRPNFNQVCAQATVNGRQQSSVRALGSTTQCPCCSAPILPSSRLTPT